MCIILTGLRSDFNESIIERAVNLNPHGIGMFCDGKPMKGLWKPGWAMKWLSNMPSESRVIFHARLATHGAVSRGNCHPFEIKIKRSKHSAYLFHNGCLPLGSPGDKGRSDSAHLAELLSGRYTLDQLVDLLSTINGRFAVGYRDEAIAINEHSWHDVGDLIASNGQLSPVIGLRSPWQWHNSTGDI